LSCPKYVDINFSVKPLRVADTIGGARLNFVRRPSGAPAANRETDAPRGSRVFVGSSSNGRATAPSASPLCSIAVDPSTVWSDQEGDGGESSGVPDRSSGAIPAMRSTTFCRLPTQDDAQARAQAWRAAREAQRKQDQRAKETLLKLEFVERWSH
jgi:hypothetical protein